MDRRTLGWAGLGWTGLGGSSALVVPGIHGGLCWGFVPRSFFFLALARWLGSVLACAAATVSGQRLGETSSSRGTPRVYGGLRTLEAGTGIRSWSWSRRKPAAAVLVR